MTLYIDVEFPGISEWGNALYLNPLPKGAKDCSFFAMLFIEFYNEVERNIEMITNSVTNKT
jgi:hypothetical protein